MFSVVNGPRSYYFVTTSDVEDAAVRRHAFLLDIGHFRYNTLAEVRAHEADWGVPVPEATREQYSRVLGR